MNEVFQKFNRESTLVKTVEEYRDRKNISVFGVLDFAKTAVIAQSERAIVLCGDISRARVVHEGLLSLGARSVMLAPKEDELTFTFSKSGENIIERLTAFHGVLSGKFDFVIATPASVLNLYPDRAEFLKRTERIKKGDEVDIYALASRLVKAGYTRVEQITDVGEIALRGDILDVFPVNFPDAVRIESFGDEVERLRTIDLDTQLSVDDIEEIEICPFAEIFEFSDDLLKRVKDGFCKKLDPDKQSRVDDVVDEIARSVTAMEITYAQNWLLPYCKHSDIFGFFGIDRLIVDDARSAYDGLVAVYGEHKNRHEQLYAMGEVTKAHLQQFYPVESVGAHAEIAYLAFHSINSSNRFFAPEAVYKISCKPLGTYVRDFRVLEGDLEQWANKKYTVYFCVDKAHRDVVSGFLRECDAAFTKNVKIVDSDLDRGCILDEDKQVFVGNLDLSVKAKKKMLSRGKGKVFTAPQVGEYVVHDRHGIGLCQGMKKMNISGAEREYIEILYAGGDKLFVPIENMDFLSKYVSTTETPKLSKMGGAEFARLKEKVRASVKKLAIDLMDLYRERAQSKGHEYSQDDSLLHEFEARFPFVETEDQLTAIAECLKDLKSGKIMDRLLCGDVGYGKTEVALRVAFKVICEGKQVAFLAPTTILAKQHFDTVKKRMEEFGVNCVRLTRLDSAQSSKLAIKALQEGRADIVVGTHKLLSKSVDFKDLGLLILDEEQRFGVSDKEKIKDAKRTVNVLTLSATPIPRTLHMSMVGIRDISVLDCPPINRIPVQTFVTEYSEDLLKDAIMREMARGGQTFVVYNKVQSIDAYTSRLAEAMPNVRFCVAHGQLSESVLEQRIDDFVAGKYDVLVASTIIENGIDMPRANTLFVVDSDKLGLSQLYQLKGRVGRSNRMAYAYFTYDEKKSMSENAYKRLDALASYTDFGSGFKLAMRDMEIRGAGNIMGAQQHGHMEKVGYDTYCALLKEEIAILEGKPVQQRKEVRMVVDYDTYIPEDFVSGGEWRLRLYSRIAQTASLGEREKLIAEIKDVYGEIPECVKNLINVALMKNLASLLHAREVVVKKRERRIVFDTVMDIDNAANALATRYEGALVLEEKPYLKFPSNNHMMKFLLNYHKIVNK